MKKNITLNNFVCFILVGINLSSEYYCNFIDFNNEATKGASYIVCFYISTSSCISYIDQYRSIDLSECFQKPIDKDYDGEIFNRLFAHTQIFINVTRCSISKLSKFFILTPPTLTNSYFFIFYFLF